MAAKKKTTKKTKAVKLTAAEQRLLTKLLAKAGDDVQIKSAVQPKAKKANPINDPRRIMLLGISITQSTQECSMHAVGKQ